MNVCRIALEKTFSQSDFDCFARLSGDDNPIHVDPAFSAQTRFGRTVAHGMLLHTVFRGLIARLVPEARQSAQELMFTAPTYADEPLLFSVDVTAGDDGQLSASLFCRRLADDVLTCSGVASLDTGGLRQ